jgi:hypothetical protein
MVECYERCRDHRQVGSSQLETTRLGKTNGLLLLNDANTFYQYIQSTCATSGDGLYEGLEWLAQSLRKAGHQ